MKTRRQDISKRTLWERPTLVLVVTLLVTGVLWVTQEDSQRGRLRLETEVTADQAAKRLSDWVEDRMNLAGYLAAKWEKDYADNSPRYEMDAAQFVDRFSGFQAINWIDSAGVIRIVVPLEGNESALNADLQEHSFAEVRDAIQHAFEERHPTRTPANINLLQGGKGFGTYWPIFSDAGAPMGYINAVFRVDEFIETCLGRIQVDNKFQIAIRESGGELVYPIGVSDDYLQDDNAVAALLNVVDQPWKLFLAPSPAYLAAHRLAVHHLTLPMGLALALVLFALERILVQRRLALESSQAQYLALFEDAPVAYLSVNPDAVIESANRVAETLTGHSKEALTGMSFYGLFPEPGHARAKARILLDLVRGGEHLQVEEMRMCHGDVALRWVLLSVEGIYDSVQSLSGFRVTITDITQRKEAEEARGRLVAAIEQAEEGVAITSESGRVQYVNPAFRAINERVEGSVLHEPIEGVFRREGAGDEVVAGIEAALEAGTRWRGSYALTLVEGQSIQVVATLSPMRDESGSVTNFVLLQRDVTYERELQEQLRQAHKMEAIGRLAGGIAHDFNNILQSLLGYTALAQKNLDDQEQVSRCLGEIERSGLRAADLVAHILAFGRKVEKERRVVRLKPVLEEVSKLLVGSLPRNIGQELMCSSTEYPIIADSTEIHQILMNLASNAAHAMAQDGGTLTMRLESVLLNQEEAALISGLREGLYMKLCVEDTGVGIEEDMLDHVFEPYFTTRVQGDGTGLGLATVHGLVEQHHGAIRVESAPGKGTSFQLFFPVAPNATAERSEGPISEVQEAESLEAQGEMSVENGARETWRVLFVDDEAQIVDSMSGILTHLGFHVTGYTSSDAAIEAFREVPDAFDVVVTDLTMPGMNGIALARELNAIREGLPIILCSGYSDMFEEEIGENDHAIKVFLKKPVAASQLRQAIEDAVSGERN
ncbi:MAG: PAS domain S-box protein [Candidatus Hydrogenedentes bacterium]|nr:PAS domain S-box protein [Candidatus Hydrogenedentota bacterium]